jgi:hypothetical protein
MSRRFDGTASISIRAYQRKLTSSPSSTIQVNRPVAYARARDPEHLRSPSIAEGEPAAPGAIQFRGWILSPIRTAHVVRSIRAC